MASFMNIFPCLSGIPTPAIKSKQFVGGPNGTLLLAHPIDPPTLYVFCPPKEPGIFCNPEINLTPILFRLKTLLQKN